MTDTEKKELANKLRGLATVIGLHDLCGWGNQLADIADELDPPAPKFKEDDWVWLKSTGKADQVAEVNVCGVYLRYCPSCQRRQERHVLSDIDPLGFGPLEIARQYHEGEPLPGYISLKDLPELPEGWEYTGEYRPPQLNEWFFGDHQGYGVCECATPGVRAFRLIVRRKAQQ